MGNNLKTTIQQDPARNQISRASHHLKAGAGDLAGPDLNPEQRKVSSSRPPPSKESVSKLLAVVAAYTFFLRNQSSKGSKARYALRAYLTFS